MHAHHPSVTGKHTYSLPAVDSALHYCRRNGRENGSVAVERERNYRRDPHPPVACWVRLY